MTAQIAFFGTPAAAVPSLISLNRQSPVGLVVTRPDKPRGRSGTPLPSDVKRAATQMGIAVEAPSRAEEIGEMLEGFDLAVVVAYGQILPGSMLSIPRRGFVNVHFSQLPRWRGAAPVARAILAGDDETGVDIIQLDEGMDTGPVLARVVAPIEPTDTTGSLTVRLADMGADLLAQVLPGLLDGSIVARAQDEDGASLARKLNQPEARLDPLAQSADEVGRRVRAFNPKPGAWGLIDGDRLKVWEVTRVLEPSVSPGTIQVVDGRPILGTSDGSIELLRVQPAGKSPMAGEVWVRGARGRLVWE